MLIYYNIFKMKCLLDLFTKYKEKQNKQKANVVINIYDFFCIIFDTSGLYNGS